MSIQGLVRVFENMQNNMDPDAGFQNPAMSVNMVEDSSGLLQPKCDSRLLC